MSDSTKAVNVYIKNLNPGIQLSAKEAAHGIQNTILAVVAPPILAQLKEIDARFQQQTYHHKTPKTTTSQRLWTPWFDILGAFASTAAFVVGAGAGRIPNGPLFSNIESVSIIVTCSLAVGILFLILGRVFAAKEHSVLAVEYENSKATVRSMFTITSLAMTIGTITSLVMRFDIDVILSTGKIALLASITYLTAALFVAVDAHRFAKSTPSKARFIHSTTGTSEGRARYQRVAARDTARDEAITALNQLKPSEVVKFTNTYLEAANTLYDRGLITRKTLRTLLSTDWAAHRYRY